MNCNKRGCGKPKPFPKCSAFTLVTVTRDNDNPRVLKRSKDFHGGVERPIVNGNQFSYKILIENSLNSFPKSLFLVVDRHDNGQIRLNHGISHKVDGSSSSAMSWRTIATAIESKSTVCRQPSSVYAARLSPTLIFVSP